MRIVDGRIKTLDILDLNVTTAKINDLAVTTGKINDLAVATGKIADLAVATGKIADLGVATGKIADLGVATGKIADLGVATGKIAANAVTDPKLRAAVDNALNARRIAKFNYSFAVNGGAFGAPIALTGDALPANSLVIGGRLYLITPLTSGGAATAAIQLVAANDIVNAALIAGVPWAAPAGVKAIIPVGTAATDVYAVAGGIPAILIGVADLTAGVFNLFLEYVVTN